MLFYLNNFTMFLRNHIEIRRKTHMTLINAIKCVYHLIEHTKDINIYHCGSDSPKNQVQYNTIQQKTQRIAIVQLKKEAMRINFTPNTLMEVNRQTRHYCHWKWKYFLQLRGCEVEGDYTQTIKCVINALCEAWVNRIASIKSSTLMINSKH